MVQFPNGEVEVFLLTQYQPFDIPVKCAQKSLQSMFKKKKKKFPKVAESGVFILFVSDFYSWEYSVLTRVLWITLHSYEIPEGEWAEEAQVSVTRGTQQHEVTETTGQCPSPGQCRSLSSLHVVPVLAVHLWVQGKDDQTKDVPMGCTAASLRLRDAAEMWPSPAQCFF